MRASSARTWSTASSRRATRWRCSTTSRPASASSCTAKARFFEGDLARRGRGRRLRRRVPPRDRGPPRRADRRAQVGRAIRSSTPRINILGALGLLQSCTRHGVRKFVYASTGGALYGEGRSLPATEDHPVNPESPYGVEQAHGRALPLPVEAAPRARLHRAALPERLRPAPEPARRGRA